MGKLTTDQLYEDYKELKALCERLNLTEYVDKCRFKMEELKEPLRFMIVGEGKSGKSTLLNALVGEEVAAVDYEPKTWCINVYYGCEREPYGELVFQNEKRKVSIEEAQAIADTIEQEKHKDILEIRWHLPLSWPPENILLIDTPGFGQLRNDTTCESIRIDIAEGIKYKEQDGFESYQYKADLVLWCIDSGSIHDAVVEEKLRNTPFDRDKIYGILTKMDQFDDARTEELCYQKCVNQYQKYVKTFIKSKLPRIRKKDSEEIVKNKEQMRRQSVEAIRYIIDFLLKDNAFESVKLDSSYAYYNVIKREITDIVSSYLAFYNENRKVIRQLFEQSGADFDELSDIYKKALTDWLTVQKNELSNSNQILELWKKSGQNMEVYETLFQAQVSNRKIDEELSERLGTYSQELKNKARYYYQSVRFKQLQVGKNDNRICDETVTFDCNTAEINAIHSSFKIADLGLSYSFFNFAKELGFGELANALFGQMIADKLVTKTGELVENLIGSYRNKVIDYLDQQSENVAQKMSQQALQRFWSYTGIPYSDVKDEILSLEKQSSRIGLEFENTKIYPYMEDGQLYFFASAYYPELSVDTGKDAYEIARRYFEQKIVPVFEKRKAQSYAYFDRLLEAYRGVEMTKPIVADGSCSMVADVWLTSLSPKVGDVVWGKAYVPLMRMYEKQKKTYEKDCEQYWDDHYQEKKQQFVRARQDAIRAEVEKESKEFIRQWNYYTDCIIEQTNQSGGKQIFPQEMNWKYFYQYHYFGYHMTDRWIPKMIQKQYGEEEKVVLEGLEKMLDAMENRNNEKWDDAINRTYDQFVKQYEQLYVELENYLMQNLPLWIKYKETAKDFNPRNRITNIFVFMTKSGRMPMVYQNLIEEKPRPVPMGIYGNWVYSDGQNVYEKIKRYLAVRAGEIRNKWGNK